MRGRYPALIVPRLGNDQRHVQAAGDSAERVVGSTSIDGSNGTRSHSTIGVTSVCA